MHWPRRKMRAIKKQTRLGAEPCQGQRATYRLLRSSRRRSWWRRRRNIRGVSSSIPRQRPFLPLSKTPRCRGPCGRPTSSSATATPSSATATTSRRRWRARKCDYPVIKSCRQGAGDGTRDSPGDGATDEILRRRIRIATGSSHCSAGRESSDDESSNGANASPDQCTRKSAHAKTPNSDRSTTGRAARAT
jgi:hypothetical protein